MLLLYAIEKKSYLGFIPTDQSAFVDRLRKVIQTTKKHPLSRGAQNQVTTERLVTTNSVCLSPIHPFPTLGNVSTAENSS